jgi:hypothetical protein
MKTPVSTEWIAAATSLQQVPKIDWFDVGKQMRALRLDSKKGLREAARAISVSPPFLCDVEKGYRSINPKKLQEFIDFCVKSETTTSQQ